MKNCKESFVCASLTAWVLILFIFLHGQRLKCLNDHVTLMSKMRILKIFIAIVVFVVIGGYFFAEYDNSHKGVLVRVGNHSFMAETVADESKRELGLGKRQSLCFDCGMLFVFDEPGKYSFWMKDMLFPIDILWISEGRVVHVEKDVQPTFTGILTPPEISDKVLEVNAGAVERNGIKTGDNVLMESNR